MAARERKCMKLKRETYPGAPPRVDVCGKEYGHEGHHLGLYRRMEWDDKTVYHHGEAEPVGP